MNIKVSIIIPTWNSCDLLLKCLDSIYRSTYENYEVIVVDNNSSDDTLHVLESRYPEVITIENKSNLGFSTAVNLGLKVSNGDIIALLNNDTTIHTKYIQAGVRCLNDKPDVSIVATKIYNINDNTFDVGDTFNVCGQAKSLRIKPNNPLKEHGRYVFSSCAGASFYRRSLFDSIDHFNEIYFMYFEDFDLCYSAQMGGHKVWFEPKCMVTHIGRASSSRNPKRLEYLLFRNYIICYLLNTSAYLMFQRLSLAKFILVTINTVIFNLKRGYFSISILVLMNLCLLLPKIFTVRASRFRNRKSIETEIYIDSWRKNKTIRIFGIRI